MEVTVGQLLLDRFVVGEPLRTVGSVHWHRAVNVTDDKPVTLKVLVDSRDAVEAAYLQREAEVLARIQHPNVVTILDYAVSDVGPCIVLERVEGPTLRDVLTTRGPVPWHDAVGVFLSALTGLEAIHGVSVVHRALAPECLTIVAGARRACKITDLSRAKAAPGFDGRVTSGGVPYERAPFRAPEQAFNLRLGQRTDVYGVALTLYEVLTGRLPPTVDAVSGCRAAAGGACPPPEAPAGLPPIPPPVAEVVVWGLATDPEERPKGARQLAEALRAARQQAGGTDPGVSAARRTSYTNAPNAAVRTDPGQARRLSSEPRPAPMRAAAGQRTPPPERPTAPRPSSAPQWAATMGRSSAPPRTAAERVQQLTPRSSPSGAFHARKQTCDVEVRLQPTEQDPADEIHWWLQTQFGSEGPVELSPDGTWRLTLEAGSPSEAQKLCYTLEGAVLKRFGPAAAVLWTVKDAEP